MAREHDDGVQDEARDVSRLGAGLRRHGLTPRPPDLSQALGRRGLHFSEGNHVELFECGRDAFPRMLEAIAGAKRFVHLETYILREDSTGQRFLAALTERAAAGVDVRVIYDAVGSLNQLGAAALQPLRGAGGDVLGFNPLSRLYPRWAPRRRDHRKLLVVDGGQAFTGGLNIGDEYDSPPADAQGCKGWRDTHVSVRGPVVRDLGAVFLESWYRAGGTDLPWHALLGGDPGQPGNLRCAVLPDGPVYRRRTMRDLLVSCLDGARETAHLTSGYFWPDRRVLGALEQAAERGVRVRMVLAGETTDHPILRRGARAMLERLLRRGVEVHEYTVGLLHAKSAVFDGRLAIVGSSNLDRQSLEHSYEVNLVTVGEALAGELDRLFARDCERSVELTLERLAKRSWWRRGVDWASGTLVRWFL